MIKEILKKAEYCLNCPTKPCQKTCPLGNDIPSFIKCIKEQNYKGAYEVLSETTVLQPICGRICPHNKQCEGGCIRGIKGEAVHIGELEAFVGDIAIKDKYYSNKSNMNKSKKVAIIGGGPTGLTCAAFLAKSGYNVTIYEAHNYLGGLLYHGIPQFRLDKKLLNSWVKSILSLGINVKYNQELDKHYTLKTLQEQYDAVFLSFGANVSCNMNIEGEELQGVYGGNELLETWNHPNYVGKKIAIIGGGNVAMDTARTIKKLGAGEVTVIYRRHELQMPAEKKEIEEAKKEGVKFLFQNNIVKILGDEKGKVNKIECIKTKLVKKKGQNREVPINIKGSNYELDMDYVVKAVGSKTREDLVKKLGVELNQNGYIKTNSKYMTTAQGLFAGGDLIGTKSTVAWAAYSGREAARAIREYLL